MSAPCSARRERYCYSVPGLVEHDLAATGQVEHYSNAVAFVDGLAWDIDSFGAQLTDGGMDIIAHQREQMADAAFVGRAFGRMHAKFRGRQSKDQPAVAGIDVVEAEDVAED